MSSKQEIVEKIQQGNAQAQRVFAGMSEDKAQTKLADGGWTVKEVLAHMAGRKATYMRLMEAAQQGIPAFTGNLDPDMRNEALVDARRDHTVDEILAEFLTVHEWLIVQVQEAPDSLLSKTITLPQIEMPLGDLLGRAGGDHTVSHMQEVEQAFSRTSTGAQTGS